MEEPAGDNDGDKARPADGRSERKKRGGRREAAVKERGEAARARERCGRWKERRREWASKCDGGRTREKDGVTLYEAGDVSQDRKSVAGILGGLLRDNASC